ncbi:putative sodium/metabolite cotransporter BASS2 chloroplastic [Prunus yedoensis var. nudiflora]|uniref:Putative sodium/metabolite cotransporter BASS2 chloroplastic n=1 Tax=Prunus yedoensis var. nudiflora TaxID=2094558 RepID=A0A314V0H3_PRUYE|nr:putative sodium/metabolite cotransporter BASS2 chloroplastic [Prunus yedoensis var. nudiflora]
MTVCTTLGEVALTPLLTKISAGTYVPVDAAKLVFSENVVRLKASMVAVTLPADLSLMAHAETVLSGEVGVCVVVEKAQGWYAKFFFGCGFGHFSFHLAGGCIARSIVCCDYEYNGKQSGILSEIYVHPSESKETPTIEVK